MTKLKRYLNLLVLSLNLFLPQFYFIDFVWYVTKSKMKKQKDLYPHLYQIKMQLALVFVQAKMKNHFEV